MTVEPDGLVGLDDVKRAAERIAGHVVRTPLVPTLWSDPARPLWLKPEQLQGIGAFKIRGALNAVGALDEEVRARGIVTSSSGNHGQAVAVAANLYGVKAIVVVPEGGSPRKVEAMRGLGAEVVLVPPVDRDRVPRELAARHGYAIVPPFDHADVIAGQGTIGLELAADLPSVATVLVPTGGGGLLSGVATVVKALCPEAKVVGVEPEFAADLAESMRLGERVAWTVEQTFRTMADGVRTVSVGELPWQHIQAYVDEVLTVTEAQIAEAMRVLAVRSRMVAEPSGAVATAAYLAHGDQLPPGPTVAIVSGGNVEPSLLTSVLAGPPDS